MGRAQIPTHKKLARALEALHSVAGDSRLVVRGRELNASDRTILQSNGYLREILKGWYFVSDPTSVSGETTLFYANFWEYLGYYLGDRFGKDYCLNAEHSLLRHVQHNIVPKQLVVMVTTQGAQVVDLAFGHSISIYPAGGNFPSKQDITMINGVQCMSLPLTMVKLLPRTYADIPDEVSIGLSMIRDVDDVVSKYLVNAAGVGRIVGGLRAIGRVDLAATVETVLHAQQRGLSRIDNPFDAHPVHVFGERQLSPVYARVKALWMTHAPAVQAMAPKPPASVDPADYKASVEAIKMNDTYHSLSIEQYRVTPELVRKVANGLWQPSHDPADQQHIAALAAKGYLEAFNSVRDCAVEAYGRREDQGFSVGKMFKEKHRVWFARMFSSSVEAGILPAESVAGYRRHMVYLRGSGHTPPHYDHVADGMTALCECLIEEPCAFTRAVLGHWLFGFVHPYMDGNGRIARFTMNVMLASGGYRWMVIDVKDRDKYMATLEHASVGNDVRPFAEFIAGEVSNA